jgi:hypothetical protein
MLDERARRLTAANEARAWGRGGISVVSRACGLSRRVIRNGLQEMLKGHALPPGRVRRDGGGRKRRQRSAIRSRRCAGRARVRERWRRRSPRDTTLSVIQPSAGCCGSAATACRPIARPRRDAIIPIATRSFGTSTPPSNVGCAPASQSSRSTPKRRTAREFRESGPTMVACHVPPSRDGA